jgi:hypothetical protein
MSGRHFSLTLFASALLTTAAQADVRTFANPQHQGYRLDYCQSIGRVCGEPVATQWCRLQGYEHASDWAVDRDIGRNIPTMSIDTEQVCGDAQCDGFATITCGREGRSVRLPNLGAATRATVITPDRRSAARPVMPVEVQVLVPGCYQTEPGILLCGTVHDYQHCRTLFAAGRLLGCRAGVAFDGAFASPEPATPESYDLDVRSRAAVTVTRDERGAGRARGSARFELSLAVPDAPAGAGTCLLRDRYVYYPTGPQGGLAEIDDADVCDAPIEGSFEPNEDDVLRAYDLCEARQAWGTTVDASIELLVAGLFHFAAPPTEQFTPIVAPYVTITAPLTVSCKDR